MKQIHLIAISLLTFLSSCTVYRYVYTTTPPNNPFFSKKGQSKLAAYYSSAGESQAGATAHGYDIQGGYAITGRWAVTGGLSHRYEKQISRGNRSTDSSGVHYKRNLVDIGSGYIIPLNATNNTTINFYGGYSAGEFSFKDENTRLNYHRFHRAEISKYYLQTSINFMPDENIYVGAVVKPLLLHYRNIRTDYSADELERFSLNLIENKTISLVEIGLNAQLGLKKMPWLKLDLIISFSSWPYYFPDGLAAHTGNLSAGLNIDFSKMKK